MDERLRGLGERLAAERGASGRRLRYSAAVKRDVIAAVVLARESGLVTSRAAAALGLSIDTLRRWFAGGTEQGGLRPVHVRGGGEPAAVTVTSPAGFRVEGLDLATAASLLRLLG